jgi:hypothetical protein
MMKDLFLCHGGADKEWVTQLAARLEAERIGNRNIEVFLDTWDIEHGDNIVAKIDEGLRTARFCGVVLSPSMLKRDWPQAEWTARFMSDPAGRKHQLLPILLQERDPETNELIDIPMLLRPIRRFDFSKQSQYESEFAELVRKLRGDRPRRGGLRSDGGVYGQQTAGAEAADDVQEVLISNLLPVETLPEFIWSDASTTTKMTDIWNSVRGMRVPPFVLEGGRLYSFFKPDDTTNPFRAFLSGAAPRVDTVTSFLADPVQARLLVRIFNDALQEHAYHLRIRNLRDNRRQFYCPVFDGKALHFKWGGGGRVRTIAKVAKRPDGEPIGIHYSAKIRFLILGVRVFLLIEPGWMFTSDGVTPLEGKQVTILSTKFGGKERNAAVLRNVLMWGMLLTDRQDRIRVSLGNRDLVIDPVPARASIAAGVDGDSMKLDKILADDAGSEVLPYSDGDGGELDQVLTMATLGALTSDDDMDDVDAAVAE